MVKNPPCNAGDMENLIPGGGTNILQAAQSETKQKYVVSSKCIIVKNGLNRASGKMPAA